MARGGEAEGEKKGSKCKRERWRTEVGVATAVCVCGCLAFVSGRKRMDGKESSMGCWGTRRLWEGAGPGGSRVEEPDETLRRGNSVWRGRKEPGGSRRLEGQEEPGDEGEGTCGEESLGNGA